MTSVERRGPRPYPAGSFALWEIVGIESGGTDEEGDAVTLFAVTDGATVPPDAQRAYTSLRGFAGFTLDHVHSIRLVTRLRSEIEAARLAGLVITDELSDQRTNNITPEDLGIGT